MVEHFTKSTWRIPMHFAGSADMEGEMAAARVKLDPQTIEAIARRVVELLESRSLAGEPELVDAAELARRLGIERSWVYTHAHAIELGAVKLGGGSKPRLRFDPRMAIGKMRKTGRSEEPQPKGPPRRRRRPEAPSGGPPLLPVKGGGSS